MHLDDDPDNPGDNGGGSDDAGKSGSSDADTADGPKIDGDFDADRAKRSIAAAREAEKKAKAEAKAAKERTDAILKAAGLTPGGNEDPAEQLKTAAADRDQKDQKFRDKSLRLAVRENADKAGADPVAVIDSATFRDTVKELDPEAADYDDQVVAAMKKAIKANPKLAATAPGGQGPARQGADHGGGNNGRQRPTSLGAALTARLNGQ